MLSRKWWRTGKYKGKMGWAFSSQSCTNLSIATQWLKCLFTDFNTSFYYGIPDFELVESLVLLVSRCPCFIPVDYVPKDMLKRARPQIKRW